MQIFNTLTRQKEEFVPQVPGEYRIYVCGPTVYNYIHIGNARSSFSTPCAVTLSTAATRSSMSPTSPTSMTSSSRRARKRVLP